MNCEDEPNHCEEVLIITAHLDLFGLSGFAIEVLSRCFVQKKNISIRLLKMQWNKHLEFCSMLQLA